MSDPAFGPPPSTPNPQPCTVNRRSSNPEASQGALRRQGGSVCEPVSDMSTKSPRRRGVLPFDAENGGWSAGARAEGEQGHGG
eukprot:CAMPEP_0114127744 /NCGR_PEP_ID=MMETSP0043_2-20121206/10551_1 /TAXON_ID=464988 /ORGANISM="Hemiselmis andersenii, Strain CCMP644" /LENGTH=82 /DNA_ID=CAMNT_0001220865 /DNA_START=45 /DNA_END=291 /DNA_ORIENTATION=-